MIFGDLGMLGICWVSQVEATGKVRVVEEFGVISVLVLIVMMLPVDWSD